ncbi:MAG: hypothetical protein VW520_01275 [Candidatus Puniceispirillum sp.]|jgi:hypothetical protein
MLTLDARVKLTCVDNDQVADGTIVRIQGNRVDVALDQGGLMISLFMKKPGLYVGSQSGLEFVMRH